MDRNAIFRVWVPLVLGLYFVGWIFVTGPGPHDGLRWLGLALSLLGLGGVILGRYTLGKSFSIAAKANELVTTGIYSRIRNPIYVSGMIFLIGMAFLIRMPALALVLIVLIPMQIIRARREAQVLEAKFGDAYRLYRATTWF